MRCVNAFVPEYRTLEQAKVNEGVYASERRPNVPLYGMMFGVMFPAAIAASTLGIARCYLNAQREYMSTRVSVTGQVAKSDPTYIQAYAWQKRIWRRANRTSNRCCVISSIMCPAEDQLLRATIAVYAIKPAPVIASLNRLLRSPDWPGPPGFKKKTG